MDQLNAQIGPDASLLLVDDDEIFVTRLARAMEKRGFQPETSLTVAGAMRLIERRAPAYAVVDLRLEDGNGLDVVEALRERRADARIIVLTGYGAIATAVAAVGQRCWAVGRAGRNDDGEAGAEGVGKRAAHATAGCVREITHRIEELARGTGGDEDTRQETYHRAVEDEAKAENCKLQIAN